MKAERIRMIIKHPNGEAEAYPVSWENNVSGTRILDMMCWLNENGHNVSALEITAA